MWVFLPLYQRGSVVFSPFRDGNIAFSTDRNRFLTSLHFFQVSRVQAVSDHTHAADAVAMSALKVRREIMDTAEVSGGRPGQILADKLATCPQEVSLKTILR